MLKAFPEQGRFLFATGMLELNEPKENTLEQTQQFINDEIKDFCEDLVRSYMKVFLNRRYTTERSKTILR